MTSEKPNLLEDPIPETIRRMAIPMAIGIVAIFLVNLVDTLYIWLLGELELAAISFTFPVISVLSTVALGLGVGCTSVLSRHIGAKQPEMVRRLATDGLILAAMIVGIISSIGLFTIDPLFRTLGAKEDTLPFIHEYMSIWYIGMCFLVIPMVGNAAIRSTGDTKTPAKIMMLAALSNCILDPIFIFGLGPIPGMGVAGAAWATLISRALAMIWSLWFLGFRLKMLTAAVPKIKQLYNSWKSVLRVGAPTAMSNALVPLTGGALTELAASYGNAAVAAYGTGNRVYIVVLVIPFAISSSMGPFVGQNWGAQKRDRIGEGLKVANRFLLKWGAIAWMIMACIGGFLVLQNASEVSLRLGYFLIIVPAACGLTGVAITAYSTFNAIDQSLKSAGLTILANPILTVTMAWFGSELFGLYGMFAGILLVDLFEGGLAWLVTKHLRKPTNPEASLS